MTTELHGGVPGNGPATLSDDQQRALVRELTVTALADSLPEELPTFLAGERTFLDQRDQPARPPGGKDVPGGFGEEFISLIPAFVAVASQVVQFVGSYLADVLKDETKPLIGDYLRKLFRLEPADKPAPAASPELLGKLNQIAVDVGRDFQLPENAVQLIASAIVGRVATLSQ